MTVAMSRCVRCPVGCKAAKKETFGIASFQLSVIDILSPLRNTNEQVGKQAGKKVAAIPHYHYAYSE